MHSLGSYPGILTPRVGQRLTCKPQTSLKCHWPHKRLNASDSSPASLEKKKPFGWEVKCLPETQTSPFAFGLHTRCPGQLRIFTCILCEIFINWKIYYQSLVCDLFHQWRQRIIAYPKNDEYIRGLQNNSSIGTILLRTLNKTPNTVSQQKWSVGSLVFGLACGYLKKFPGSSKGLLRICLVILP